MAITREEANAIVIYYEGFPLELAAMKREIGLSHPAVRYIEALEFSLAESQENESEANTQLIEAERDAREARKEVYLLRYEETMQ